MQFSEQEWKIMNVVWNAPAAVSTRDVLAELEGDTGWAYTTVKTMLTRLEEKGALAAQKVGKASHYRARVSRPDARRAAVGALIDRAFGTPGQFMAHLVSDEKLSKRDLKKLKELLREEGLLDG